MTQDEQIQYDNIELTHFNQLPYPVAERRNLKDKTWEKCKVVKLCEENISNGSVNYWVVITIFGDVKKVHIEDVRFYSAIQ